MRAALRRADHSVVFERTSEEPNLRTFQTDGRLKRDIPLPNGKLASRTSHFRTDACNRAALRRAGHFAVTLLVITETVPFDMCIGFKMLAVEVPSRFSVTSRHALSVGTPLRHALSLLARRVCNATASPLLSGRRCPSACASCGLISEPIMPPRHV